MKRLLTISVILISAVVSAFAQKVDYTQFEVLAKSGDVSVVAKDNYYRMVVGPLKNPKKVIFLGYSKDQVDQMLEHLLKIADNDVYTKTNRQITFCGVIFLLTIEGTGDNERYTFVEQGKSTSFVLSKSDLHRFINI